MRASLLLSGAAAEVLLAVGSFELEAANVSNAAVSALSGGAGADWDAMASYASGLYLRDGDGAAGFDVAVSSEGSAVVAGRFDAVCDGCTRSYGAALVYGEGGDVAPFYSGLDIAGPDDWAAYAALETPSGRGFVGGRYDVELYDGSTASQLMTYVKASGWVAAGSPSNETALACGAPAVRALVWDSTLDALYAGGCFDSVGAGLAQWTSSDGLVAFPGGGVFLDQNRTVPGEVRSLALDAERGVLVTAGDFAYVGTNGSACAGVAAWSFESESWGCSDGLAGQFASIGELLATADGTMLVAGTMADGSGALARFHPASGSLEVLATAAAPVLSVAVTAGGAIVYGGCFPDGVGAVDGALELPGMGLPADGSACVRALTAVEAPAADDDGGGGGGGDDDDATEEELLGIFVPAAAALLCYAGFASRDRLRWMLRAGRRPSNDDEAGVDLDGYVALSARSDGEPALDLYSTALQAHAAVLGHTLAAVDPDDVALEKVIGHGAFSKVWRASWRGEAVAVKELVFAQSAIAGGSISSPELVQTLMHEVRVMVAVRHPQVLRILGCCVTLEAVWIVTELCERGSLRAVLETQTLTLTRERRVRMAMDIAEGLWHLHSRHPPVVHRDIKSSNMLVCEDWGVKVGDWGTAREVAAADEMTGGVGSACWLAPEVIRAAQYSPASDVFAFGIVLWELFAESPDQLYGELSSAQVVTKVAYEGLRPEVPPGCVVADLMRQCWAHEPADRPTSQEALQALERVLEGTSDIVLL